MTELYELINHSDQITFRAKDDKVAMFCVLTLGHGVFMAERDGEHLPIITMFSSPTEEEVEQWVLENLGASLREFRDDRRADIADCFDSFAYGSRSMRHLYDDAVAAITNPEKLAEFKATQEDRNRTSTSQIVKAAWMKAERLRKEAE